MKRYLQHSFVQRAVAALLAVLQVFLYMPTAEAASAVLAQLQKPPAKVAVTANRTLPKVTPPSALPNFSPAPSDEEITHARVF